MKTQITYIFSEKDEELIEWLTEILSAINRENNYKSIDLLWRNELQLTSPRARKGFISLSNSILSKSSS